MEKWITRAAEEPKAEAMGWRERRFGSNSRCSASGLDQSEGDLKISIKEFANRVMGDGALDFPVDRDLIPFAIPQLSET
jgi:hypothetical protein